MSLQFISVTICILLTGLGEPTFGRGQLDFLNYKLDAYFMKTSRCLLHGDLLEPVTLGLGAWWWDGTTNPYSLCFFIRHECDNSLFHTGLGWGIVSQEGPCVYTRTQPMLKMKDLRGWEGSHVSMRDMAFG